MSCKNCDEVQDKGDIAYYRLGKANVGILACDEHTNELMRAVDGRQQDRVIVRVKNQNI